MNWWERATPLVRALLVGGVVVVVAVAVAVPLLVTRGHGSTPTAPPEPTCGAGGCATVSSVQQLSQVTILTGASCEGPRGSWFFHAIEQGAPTQLRPNYSLRFNFSATATTAAPNGQISIPPTTDTTLTMTLNDGALRLTGTHAGKPVTASGTLSVALTGTAAAPSLTFTESGLTPAEASVGLASPFSVGGAPLVLPIKTVTSLTGC